MSDEQEQQQGVEEVRGKEAAKEEVREKSVQTRVGCACPVDHSLEGGGAPGAGSSCTPVIDLKQLSLLNFGASAGGGVRTLDEARRHRFRFWETQPVAQFGGGEARESAVIELAKDVGELRREPFSLPPGFDWAELDVGDEAQLGELYALLNENYVEDDDNLFRFDYSPHFLRWALQPPGWQPGWHVGVRAARAPRRLLAFIAAVPATVQIYDREQPMVEVNFLCVHKRLRQKRVAPVLIREVTRRVNLHGLFQAVYTAGVILPRPVCTSRYWHRSLNPKKLIDVKFSQLGKNMTLQRTVKLYKLPAEHRLAGFRPLVARDLPQVHRLLGAFLRRFDLAPVLSLEDCAHWLLPRPNVVHSFVVEQPGGKVTDVGSFYALASTVVEHPVHKSLRAAYSFYNVAGSVPLAELVHELLVAARNLGFDVFNALDLMHNGQFLEKLKFGPGDGNLQYYLYNWKCPEMRPDQVALVLQ